MSDVPDGNGESQLPREDLEALPLGYRTIWEHPLLSRDALRVITLRNARWRSAGPARSSEKPISKIVSFPQKGEHGSDSAPR